jgi:anti-sigma regulatory factor (Ser/Thr protein kinase)
VSVVREVTLGRAQTAPRLARVWLTSELEDLGVLSHFSGSAAESLRVMTSELVTNVIVHTQSVVVVRVRLGDKRLRVEVHDQDARSPRLEKSGPLADGGRGLVIVEQMSEDWGFESTATDGKQVWFVVAFDR